MTNPNRGMILDRYLTPDQLDVALRIATQQEQLRDQHRLLTIALRDQVSDQEAAGKTKDCLAKVWISPRAEAAEMIAWGREHPQLVADRRTLHLGALFATFPFAGAIAGIVGRSLALDQHAELQEVRKRARATWGDRSSIDVGARKTCRVLVGLGVLTGGGRKPFARGELLEADEGVAGWLIHALLLTRGVTSISDSELGAAPELFWAKLGRPDGAYPLLERHNEGGRRVVWAAGAQAASGQSKLFGGEDALQLGTSRVTNGGGVE